MNALAIVLLGLAPAAPPKLLGPGSPAPKLEVRRWLKGEPVARFEKGKTYVVEFWAWWCGPCRQSVPHLTELAKTYPRVTFLGIGIWQEDGPEMAEYMKEFGGSMGYRIAYSGNRDDGMAATWMRPAAQRGIPAAFVVKDRRIVWIGSPFSLDGPLKEIAEGKFDITAFKRRFEAEAREESRKMALDDAYAAIMKRCEGPKRAEGRRAYEAFIVRHPEYGGDAERLRYDWLADEDEAAWLAKTRGMLATGRLAEMQKVATFALIRSQTPGGAVLARTAIEMVRSANAGDDFDLMSYGLGVYLNLKEWREALAITNRMIALFPKDPPKDFPFQLEGLRKRKADIEAKLAGEM